MGSFSVLCLILIVPASLPMVIQKEQSAMSSLTNSVDRPEIELPDPQRPDSDESKEDQRENNIIDTSIMEHMNSVDDLAYEASNPVYIIRIKRSPQHSSDKHGGYYGYRQGTKTHPNFGFGRPGHTQQNHPGALGGIKPNPRQPRQTHHHEQEHHQIPVYVPPHYQIPAHHNPHEHGHHFNHPNYFHYPRV